MGIGLLRQHVLKSFVQAVSSACLDRGRGIGIGEKKLRRMIEDYQHLGLFLQIGSKHAIKRQKFEEFLNDAYTI